LQFLMDFPNPVPFQLPYRCAAKQLSTQGTLFVLWFKYHPLAPTTETLSLKWVQQNCMFIGTPHQEVLLATCQYPRLMTHPEGLLQIPRYASLSIPTLFPTQVFIQITNNPALGLKSSSGRLLAVDTCSWSRHDGDHY
jgi:hypothetical protein